MRLLQSLALVAVFLLVEVNAFVLKYVLWVPPLNPLNTYRLCLFFLLGIPAVREYYIFIENNEVRHSPFLGVSILMIRSQNLPGCYLAALSFRNWDRGTVSWQSGCR